MIKNIAAAAALAFATALLVCSPAQAAAPATHAAPAATQGFPLPPFGFYTVLPAPLIWHAPLIHRAYPATYVVHHLH
jgi:hypothetical protein